MRIVAGIFKSRIINAPDGLNTRPSSDKTRQAIYNVIAPYVYDANVLDIFAGSGALGLEALSRGAKKATFIDLDESAIKCINSNISMLSLKDKTNVIKGDYKQISSLKEKFDIILLDPPYKLNVIDEIIQIINQQNLLSDYGIIVYESDALHQINKEIKGFEVKVKKYGIAHVNFLYKKTI